MSKHHARIWSLTAIVAVAMFITSLAVPFRAAAQPAPETGVRSDEGPLVSPKETNQAAEDYKKNGGVSYVTPDELTVNMIARARAGANASDKQVEAEAAKFVSEWSRTTYHGPDPQAYARLQRNEQRALAANSSPAALGLAVTGTLRLLTVLVDFTGTDTAANFTHPVSVNDRTCVTDTDTFSGPSPNQIPAPGPQDNYSFWKSSFDRNYYEKLISSTEGITERVRPDLTDPEDGKPGINIAGYTMRNYYAEQSGGKVQFDTGPQGVVGWVQLPRSEAYYAADACTLNPDTGEYEAGGVADMDGLPQNPSVAKYGTGRVQIVPDVIAAINAANPNFPWADYDTNGDGVIDRVVFVHAGEDRARGGAISDFWAHRSGLPETSDFVADDNGTPDPSDDIRFGGYTMQYEALDLGVLAHEFGHDLGYPDLYSSNDNDSESNVVWFDLMSTASNLGKLGGFPPAGLSAWTKFALGWTDPKVVAPGTTPQQVMLGQSSIPPAGTTQAVRVDLPPTDLVYTDPSQSSDPNSTQAWWTNNDANLAEVTLSRDVSLTGRTAPITVSYDIDFEIEQDWDYLFTEVSTDGGATYTSLPAYLVGETPPVPVTVGGSGYSDPNGNLRRFGGGYAFTGSSGGWIRVYNDLSAYAGRDIKLRFRYNTDEAVVERGAFIDNLAVTRRSTTILNDPIESTAGWTTAVAAGAGEIPSAGWVLSNGIRVLPKYYLVEWRNLAGFDKSLAYAYSTIFGRRTESGAREFRVSLIRANVPGMLVWLRDTRFGNDPLNADNSILDSARFSDDPNFAFPSEGPKGGLLLVDANFQPLRANRGGTINVGAGNFPYPAFDNWNGRVQSINSAFSLQKTPELTLTYGSGTQTAATTVLTPTTYAPLPAVSGFHDALGYYPGVEELPQPVATFANPTTPPFLRLKRYAFADPDASVVIPAKGYYPPRTPAGFTGAGAETSPPASNVSTFETLVADSAALNLFNVVNIGGVGGFNVTGEQSGNPGDYGVQYGNHFEIVSQARDGSYGMVRFYNGDRAATVSGSFNTSLGFGKPITVTASLQNVGSPTVLTLYSDFDESRASYVEGSATNGAVPVRATRTQVESAVRERGLAGLESLRVMAGEATAVVGTSPDILGAGKTYSFNYGLLQKKGSPGIYVVNRAFGVSVPTTAQQEFVQLIGSELYVPVIRR